MLCSHLMHTMYTPWHTHVRDTHILDTHNICSHVPAEHMHTPCTNMPGTHVHIALKHTRCTNVHITHAWYTHACKSHPAHTYTPCVHTCTHHTHACLEHAQVHTRCLHLCWIHTHSYMSSSFTLELTKASISCFNLGVLETLLCLELAPPPILTASPWDPPPPTDLRSAWSRRARSLGGTGSGNCRAN